MHSIKSVFRRMRRELATHSSNAQANLDWLRENLHPYFFVTVGEDADLLITLANNLHRLSGNRGISLIDRDDSMGAAYLNRAGTLFRSLRDLSDREISYAEFTHSLSAVPGREEELEVQRYEFMAKSRSEINDAAEVKIPQSIRGKIVKAQRTARPETDMKAFKRALELLWLNNERYVRISPPERVARVLYIFLQGKAHNGLYIDGEPSEDATHQKETRILFSVGNPPPKGFLAQIAEVFHRLQIKVRRAYCLSIQTGVHPYFLSTFYVTTREDEPLSRDSKQFIHLKRELYNTQILRTSNRVYEKFVMGGVMTGDEATLTNAMAAFSYMTLSHAQPDRYDFAEVSRVFSANPQVALRLTALFRHRFAPRESLADGEVRDRLYTEDLESVEHLIETYNTGHRHLDTTRKTVFRTALTLIVHTLRTNFFVSEKHGLAFRLDPAYLKELGEEFTYDLPAGEPFRITFFFGRHSSGFHVGFSDIARGGWRTIVCRTIDDFVTNTATLFREAYVLAHTQHLKNKDIYEGGSKLAMVLNADDLSDPEMITQRLYKEQYGLINGFLDIYVTEGGVTANPNVVDYYREDEPIELGPDENMHDEMIGFIARLSKRRGYLLGPGIMSSKEVGINHKQYGVTSLGVITFAEIVMKELGIDMATEPFTVKITGGTNGDVAGNCIRLMLERSPKARIILIIAGSGVLYDPEGLDHGDLSRIVLRHGVDDFSPEKLSLGGFLLKSREWRKEGLKEYYKKIVMTGDGPSERWISSDEFHRDSSVPLFEVDADLFIPAGGRPETIDEFNCSKLLDPERGPTCRVISEGANSFITPTARRVLERGGIAIVRDASANKCGVISSSYEIIANLMMSDAEFLAHKEEYVTDVLTLLEKRASDEAHLLLRRRREAIQRGEEGSLTEISDQVSREINGHYARLFDFFKANPGLTGKANFREVIFSHLPDYLRNNPKLRRRLKRLPQKYLCAILASEIAAHIVYRGDWEEDLAGTLENYVRKSF